MVKDHAPVNPHKRRAVNSTALVSFLSERKFPILLEDCLKFMIEMFLKNWLLITIINPLALYSWGRDCQLKVENILTDNYCLQVEMVIGQAGQVGQHAARNAIMCAGENVTIHPQLTGDIIALELTMTQMIVREDYVGGLFGLNQVFPRSQQIQHLLLPAKSHCISG